MKKTLSDFSIIAMFVVIIAGSIGGCNDTPCDFEFNSFLNGSSLEDQTSEWDCKRGDETIFTMGLFFDLTGIRSDIGEFDYDLKKCRTMEFDNELGSGKLKNMQGNSTLGTFSFKQVSDDFGDDDFICDLIEF